jgi:hypothetical protein
LRGATLVFDVINDTEMEPSLWITLLYTTAAYALVDASAKACSWMFSSSLTISCCSLKSFSVSRSARHLNQFLGNLLGNGQSQSKLTSQRFWNMILKVQRVEYPCDT